MSLRWMAAVSRSCWTADRQRTDSGQSHTFAAGSGQVIPAPLQRGDRVVQTDGTEGIVLDRTVRQDRPIAQVHWFNGQTSRVLEGRLRPAEISDPVERFKEGRIDSHEEFNLRSVAAELWIRNHSEQFISLSHAKFDLMPHQVGVLHRVMSKTPHRFLLCDEVGLGKTIEAAMVIKELRSRGLAERILIICPANLQRQWQYELKTKFNETFRIFNRNTLQYLRGEGASNPWIAKEAASVITSHQFAANNEKRRQEISTAPWDLVIVDEAHHARRRRQGNRVEQTNLYRLVRDLTAESGLDRRSVLFLTATPMQLQYHELYSLVELLDHTLFPSEEDFADHIDARSSLIRLMSAIEGDPAASSNLKQYRSRAARWLPEDQHRNGPIQNVDALLGSLRSAHRLSEVMLRNRRASVGGFMPRTATIWDVELDSNEQAAQAAMESVISDGYRAVARATARSANAIGFLMTMYQKLAASSSRALLASLESRRQRLLESESWRSSAAALDPEAAAERLEEDELTGTVTAQLDPTIADEADRIGDVIDLLREIKVDSKAGVLRDRLRIINQNQDNAKVLIFTQFRETQEMLRQLLMEEGWDCDVFHGQLNPDQKDQAIIRFRDGVDPQVLISTEAGGEGRNLQFANILVNYDLPWNPMKVEQRIGRIDRIGQEREILIFNFRVVGTIEERILEVLHNRIGLFENAIGGLEPILGNAENDIRSAMREAADKRDAALLSVGRQLQRRIEAARKADQELGQLYFDSAEYQDEIKRLIGQAEQESFRQRTVDQLILRLLQSVNAMVTPPGDGARFPIGQRRVEFYPPFSIEQRDLLDGRDQRLVCFDPKQPVASSDVEYFGFGHPIVNALIKRTTQDSDNGKAAVRVLSRAALPAVRQGWQFNWRFRLHAAEEREWLRPIFVDDDGLADETLGAALLRRSQDFADEGSLPADWAPAAQTSLDEANEIAERIAAGYANQLESERRTRAVEAYQRGRSRLDRLYEIRVAGARERLESDQQILERVSLARDPIQRQVIPIWRFNVRRSTEAIDRIQEEWQRELGELDKTREPNIAFDLLNVARIEVRETGV